MKDIVKDFVRRKSSIGITDIGHTDMEHAKEVDKKVGEFLEEKLTPNEDTNHL